MPSLPPWPIVQGLLVNLILPCCLVAGGVFWAMGKVPRFQPAAAPLGLGAGLIAGNVRSGLLPWWSLEPGWPSLLAGTLTVLIAAAIAGILAERGTKHAALVIRVAGLGVVAWWLTPADLPLSRIGSALVVWMMFLSISELLQRVWFHTFSRIGTLLLGLVWGWAAATVLIFAHSARFSDLAVLLMAGLVGIGMIAAWQKEHSTCVAPGPATYFPILMLAGATNTYSEVPVASFVLVGIAPLGLSIAPVSAVRNLSPIRRTVVVLMTLLVPLITGVALAVSQETLDFG